MATHDVNLADHSGQLLESHRGYDPRLIFFYFLLAALLVTLGVGLGYQQLQRTGEHNETERQQSQRRIVVPGPRGNIVDRNGRLLVGNRPRFSVRLQLDTLRTEMYREAQIIRKAFRDADDVDKSDLPTAGEVIQLARLAVVQRYLDQVNAIIGRQEKANATSLRKHFSREMLLPFTLIDDLQPAEYARLLERLPVNSPAQLHTMSTRYFPYGSSAAHTLGYVGSTDQLEVDELEGDDLKTFRMKGTVGRDGVEKKYDSRLQGEAGEIGRAHV